MDSDFITRSIWPGEKFYQTKQTIPYLRSPLLNQFKKIQHGFFGRRGQLSQNTFISLNMGYHKGDSDQRVNENRKLICDHFDVRREQLIVLKQVHGTTIIEIDDRITNQFPLTGDAIITRQQNLVLGVLTADCLPILIYDSKTNYIAAVHAGRKGLQQNILEKVLDYLIDKGARCDSINVAIGPAIHQSCYQVGPDISDTFSVNKPSFSHHIKLDTDSYYYMDLFGIAEQILKSYSITQYDVNSYNTYHHPELFFSCRYAYHQGYKNFGNQISAIRLA